MGPVKTTTLSTPLLSVAAILPLATGCSIAADPPPSGQASAHSSVQRLSVEELGERLRMFENRFRRRVAEAANRIKSESDDPVVRKRALIWSLRSTEDLDSALDRKVPLHAFLDAWALCVQSERYFEHGAGRADFGDQSGIALEAVRELTADIRRIGASFLSPQHLSLAEADIEAFSAENPIGRGFSRPAMAFSEAGSRGARTLAWISDVTLTPFRAIGNLGLSDTAAAIREFAAAADRLNDLLRETPEELRLQTEILLLDADSLPTVREARAALERVAQDMNRVVELAGRLPAELRREVTVVLEDLDRDQQNIQRTLELADATIARCDPVLVRSRELLEQADIVAASLERTANAWGETAEAIGRHVIGRDESTEAEPPSGSPTHTSAPDQRPFDILDYARTADALTRTAERLIALCEEIERLRDPTRVEQSAEALSRTTGTTLRMTRAEAERLLDHAFWRACQFVLVVFVATLAYRAAVSRLRRRTRS